MHEDKDKEKTWDDTEFIVKDLIKKKLNYEGEIEIERAHRVGKKHCQGRQDGSGKTSPRPIVAKISNLKVKEAVLREARKIKPEGVMFYNDLAKRTLNRRTEQIPEMVKYRKQGLQAYFIRDRLIVRDKDGKLIRPRSRPGPSDNGGFFSDDDEDDEVTFKQGYFK